VVLSRHLRDWFEAELGTGFRADGHLRKFLAEGAGQTLGDAADHWLATRGMPVGEIGSQFEFNRFTRSWWQANPGGTPNELREAWLEYRSTPAGQRSMPGEDSG